jgi:hypothetical protein
MLALGESRGNQLSAEAQISSASDYRPIDYTRPVLGALGALSKSGENEGMASGEPLLPLSDEQITAYQVWAHHPLEGPAPFGDAEDPLDQLALILQLAEASPDDPVVLCWIAVERMEALIDLHWPQVLTQVERAAAKSAALRRVISGCDFDVATPEAVRDRLSSLVGPDDDVGHRPA